MSSKSGVERSAAASDRGTSSPRAGSGAAILASEGQSVAILPVLDLKGGLVVRGVAGNREQYRPIESRWAKDPTPRGVAEAFARHFGFRTAYVADLDAITGGEPQWDAYRAIAAAGLELWVDAGVRVPDDVEKLLARKEECRIAKVVLGSESLGSNSLGSASLGSESVAGQSLLGPNALAECLRLAGSERIVFSLDLKSGKSLAVGKGWGTDSPRAMARRAIELGVRSMIVLDLAGVGVGQGVPTLELCRQIRTEVSNLSNFELISGGGVRSVDDLRAMADAGCKAALVASALHDGRIMP